MRKSLIFNGLFFSISLIYGIIRNFSLKSFSNNRILILYFYKLITINRKLLYKLYDWLKFRKKRIKILIFNFNWIKGKKKISIFFNILIRNLLISFSIILAFVIWILIDSYVRIYSKSRPIIISLSFIIIIFKIESIYYFLKVFGSFIIYNIKFHK